jgi:hypothetical protein
VRVRALKDSIGRKRKKLTTQALKVIIVLRAE